MGEEIMSLIVNCKNWWSLRVAFAWSAERGGPRLCVGRFRCTYHLNAFLKAARSTLIF